MYLTLSPKLSKRDKQNLAFFYCSPVAAKIFLEQKTMSIGDQRREWLADERYTGDRELEKPLGAVQMGFIYVNPGTDLDSFDLKKKNCSSSLSLSTVPCPSSQETLRRI